SGRSNEMKELFEKKQDWTDVEVQQIEYNMLKGILGCRSTEAVESAITYASYLNFTGITNGNYPVFLNLLTVRNHNVIDAFLGTRDPFLFMSSIQPNYFIVSTCFAILTKYRRSEIYPKTLGVILGVFQTAFSSPLEGYKIYPPTVADVNSLGKHLNEEKGQDDPHNRGILDILDKLSELEGQNVDGDMEDLAVHAHNIRNNFFDSKKHLVDVIPEVQLRLEPNPDREIQPRNRVPLREAEKPST
ncbi:MAG TPA: hypothetical protein PKO22_06545, partial [Treponemataceae bacterium]|nr:hypothetical protein [Treponemataceae bacterium]